MLDQAKVLEAMQSAVNMGHRSSASLGDSFVQGASKMQMSGSDAARSVLNHVTQSSDTMLGSMKGIFKGLQDDLTSHQTMQAQEQPKDADVNMSDLRDTIAKGLPSEMADFFSKLPRL
ncbi:DUF6277 family protein [Pseudomonas chlororaphis]|uniref:Uncharacterized protein n=1 Tax=Pseudomonas chlororaphis O6 TaxID=1037915 RepID=A0AB33X088_9PSED|nr:DUF6277 family protein [Pseudomonas chlororaphis]EIM18740.1 hypothetical protein PchlO6_6111 [Pseudomonas chlororaphis O6]